MLRATVNRYDRHVDRGVSARCSGLRRPALESGLPGGRRHTAAAVGHWGHIHERRNAYQADLTIEPVDGAWKLTDVEILDEVRVQ